MNDRSGSASSKRINVLTLDGGGVRGLSTLLILRVLMQKINESIRSIEGGETEHHDVEPHHIFDLVAGTSTGGLIAIMIGKLGMTVGQCIDAYYSLSATIFGSKHLRARFSGGLAPAKYSGSRMRRCVRALVLKHRDNEELPMLADPNGDRIACALICREHRERSKYSDFKSAAVCICSLPCPDALGCLVCDAARATSAAPTFFPVQKIDGRYFADGGMEFNNPSHEIFDHYTRLLRAAESRRTSLATEAAVLPEFHGNLDFSEVRFINLGTGTEPNIEEFRTQRNFAFLVPGALRMFLFLKKNLTKMATNSERVAGAMRTIAHVSSSGNIRTKYERFSADNGVCFIKMDKYKRLKKIEDLTMEYVESQAIQRELGRVAEEIARDYLEKRRAETAPTTADRLVVPVQSTRRPQTPPRSPQSTATQANTKELTDHSDGSTDNTPSRHSSTEATSISPSSIEVSPSRQISNVVGSALEASIGNVGPVHMLTA